MKILFVLVTLATFLSTSVVKTGTIKGKICFPSDFIPEMNVYIKNLGTSEIYTVKIEQGQIAYEVKNITSGTYIAYAYPIGKINYGKNKVLCGGYTQYVTCGLTVDCTDHTLVEFNVKSGKVTRGIDICDWYGAIVPPE